MPGDEYASVVRGGLKLKGGAPAGVKKKKKKSKAPSTSTESKSSALEAALGDEDPNSSPSKDIVLKKGKGKAPEDDELVPEDDDHEDLKTASERAHEEMRRKRVYDFYLFRDENSPSSYPFFSLEAHQAVRVFEHSH
jgi:protein FAM32A